MMTQMGQKPSEQKVRQIAASMKAQAKKRAKKVKVKTIGIFRWFFSLYRIWYNVIFYR